MSNNTPYYFDLLSKLVTNVHGIEKEELCCQRLDYRTFEDTMQWLLNKGYVVEVTIKDKPGYKSTYEGNMHVMDTLKKKRERQEAEKDPNSIRMILDKLETCWIPVDKLLPENATEMEFSLLNPNFKFAAVIVRDDAGHVDVRNRILQTPSGNLFLDAAIKTSDWHWSNGPFEPTHWMPLPKN